MFCFPHLLAATVRTYLTDEWLARKKEATELFHSLKIQPRVCLARPRPTHARQVVTLPYQRNDCDCGVFMLQYTELFLREAERQAASSTLRSILEAVKESFSTKISLFRQHLREELSTELRRRRASIESGPSERNEEPVSAGLPQQEGSALNTSPLPGCGYALDRLPFSSLDCLQI